MRRAGGSIISATVPVSPVSVVLVVGLFGQHCIVGESQLEAASCEPSVGGGVYRALLFKGQCAACTSHRRQSSGVGVQMPPHSEERRGWSGFLLESDPRGKRAESPLGL